jgi:tetratricopeptide (TPR) repeat protein
MNDVGMNGEWAAAKLREAWLREQCAGEVELYMHTLNCDGPELKAKYMVELGQHEHRVFQLKTDVSRWQRRFTLLQAARNRGEKPDFCGIEATLDAEFEAYLRLIKEHQAALRETSELLSTDYLSDAANAEIRLNYLTAVKKLHPDLNPGLPDDARELWTRIQTAYENKDWENLKFLSGIVDEVVGGAAGLKSENGLEGLKAGIVRLEAKLADLRKTRAALLGREPYRWKELLKEREEVERRRGILLREIEELERATKEYERIWNLNGKKVVK